MVEILAEFEAQLEAVRLLPTVGGVYEVSLDGRLVYSKLATGRHAEPGEVMGWLRDKLPGGGRAVAQPGNAGLAAAGRAD